MKQECAKNQAKAQRCIQYIHVAFMNTQGYLVLPWSLEMSGLYQNLDVSWTNLTLSLLSGLPSAAEKVMMVTFEPLQSVTDIVCSLCVT